MVYLGYLTHFYHKNITKGESSWIDYSMIRDFDTIDNMTDAIVDGINKYVKEDDILIHLGDWSFGGKDKILKSRERIVCKNIMLIFGNHDMHIAENKIIDESMRKASDLFQCLGFSNLIQIDKKLVYLSHFPVDNVRFDKPSYHLHGHMHGVSNVIDYALKKDRLDVGIDSAFSIFGEYKPFSWEEVQNNFK